MADARINAIIDAQWRGSGDTRKATRDLDQLEQKAKDTGGGFEKFTTGLVATVDVFDAFGASFDVLVSAFETAQLGAQIIRTGETFELLAGQIGEDIGLLEELQQVTGNTVSDLQLLEAVNTVVAFGFAETGDEATELIGLATKLGSVFSDSADPVADFTNLLKNESIEVLDSFGISSGFVRERIAELTTGVNALDRSAAFVQATMEGARAQVKNLGLEGDITADAFTRLTVVFENLQNRFAVFLAEGLEPAAKILTDDYGQAISKIVDENIEAARSTDDLVDAVIRLREQSGVGARAIGVQDELEEGIKKTRLEIAKSVRTIDEFVKANNEIERALNGNVRTVDRFGNGVFESTELLNEFNEAQAESFDITLRQSFVIDREAQLLELLNSELATNTALSGLNADAINGQAFARQRNSEAISNNTLLFDLETAAAARNFAVIQNQVSQRIKLRESIEAIQTAQQQAFGADFQAALQAEEQTINFTNSLLEQSIAAGASAEDIAALAIITGEYSDEQITNALKQAAMNEQIGILAERLAANEISAIQARDALIEFETKLDDLSGKPTELGGQIDTMAGRADNAARAVRDAGLALDELDGRNVEVDVIINIPREAFADLDAQIAARQSAINGQSQVLGNNVGTTSQNTGNRPTPRQFGGPLNAGQLALVGERGPELFIPNTAGQVIPNNQLTNIAPNITINVNSPMMATPAAIAGAVAQKLGEGMRG